MDNNKEKTSGSGFADNFFNTKLYLQGLKRLRVTALVSFVCLTLFSILTIISESMDITNYNEGFDFEPYILSTTSSSFVLLVVVLYIIVPLMTLIIFHYLTTRNGSDFYHSVAPKRRCVYLSFLAAVVTWALIIIVAFSIVTSITYAIYSSYFIIDMTCVLIYTFNVFIGCALVAAVFGIGCTITGTVFSNLVASVSILFFPRLLITIICALISSENNLVGTNTMATLTRVDCNIPVSLFFEDTLSTLSFSTIYTLLLATIYIALGAFTYAKRPSETAGKSASSKKIQFVIRMILGYTISLIAVSLTYSAMHYDMSSYDKIEMTIALLFTFAAIIVFTFIYELITVKSVKSSLKSLLTLPLIVVADIVTLVIIVFFD